MKMDTVELLQVPALKPPEEVALLQKSETVKKELILSAETITEVKDTGTRDRAITIAGIIKGFLDQFDAYRKEVKGPHWNVCQKIDELSRNYIKELRDKLHGLEAMIGEFEEEERIRQQKLLRAQQEAGDKAALLSAELDLEDHKQTYAPPVGRGSNRSEWDIEVYDIKLLYNTNPGCVKLEPDLMQIKYLLNQGYTLPGVKATKKAVFKAKGRK